VSASVLMLAACSNEPGPLEGGTELRLPTHPDWEDGPEALISGEVEFDEATGCVYLDNGTVPVWPPGTRATSDPFRVVLEDGREIREGDSVEGAGGEYAFEVDAMGHCPSGDANFTMLNWAEDIVIRPARE
jgi:hypothetical protein